MRIAITGATGFIGSHLVQALCARGHELTCLARTPDKARALDGFPLRFVSGDLDSPDALASLVTGQDAIIHMAGLTKAPNLEGYARVNVQGTEKLMNAVRRTRPGLGRFVFLSSAEAMGPNPDGAPLTEDAPPRPLSAYGKSKIMAEERLAALGGDIPLTIIRPPVVYGPRDRDIAILFRMLSRGFQPVVSPPPAFSVLYVKNLVAGICLAVESAGKGIRTYFFTDGPACSWKEFGCLIARALGKKPFQLRVPLAVVRAIAHVAGFFSALTGKTSILSRDKIEEMISSWVVSDERARRELGYIPPYTTEQGVTETASWYRQQGWVK